MELWERAYEDRKAGMKYRDIASKYGVSVSAVKNWQKRKWPAEVKPKPETKPETTETVRVSQDLDKGGAPERNSNAATHGLYSRYLPEEIIEIMQASSENPLDLLLEKIKMISAKITHSFKIQFVKDKDDYTKRIISDGEKGTLYDYKEAFDKDANFLHALSSMMRALTAAIKEYEDRAAKNPELETELQRARLEKAKAEARQIKAEIEGQTDDDVRIIINVPRPDPEGDDDGH